MNKEEYSILSPSGIELYKGKLDANCIRKFSLMSEDSVTLKFSSRNAIRFPVGSSVGDFFITKQQVGTWNANTGVWDYQQKFDAYYWSWANKILRYVIPGVDSARETSFTLTATIDVHASMLKNCLDFLNIRYDGSPFRIDTSDSSLSAEPKLVRYENLSVLGGIQAIAEAFECEWWVDGNAVCFGKCESNTGSNFVFEAGKNVSSISYSQGKTEAPNRIYVYGSDRNLPTDYRKANGNDTINGVVNRRLMLPQGIPYLQTKENIPESEIVETVVVLDDVYPKTNLTVSEEPETYSPGKADAETQKPEDEDDVNIADNNPEVNTIYYRLKYGKNFLFLSSYILPDEELHIVFTSGLLNGMDFGARFNPKGVNEKDTEGNINPESQMFEVIANEDYGRLLPDDVLKPRKGDTFILYGWDSTKMADLGLIAEAEQELLTEGKKALQEYNKDLSTCTCPMSWDYMKPLCAANRQPKPGDMVTIIDTAHFGEGGRKSRIIGFEYKLDQDYASYTYTCGENISVPRLQSIENKIEGLAKSGTKMQMQNSLDFLSKRYADRTPYLLSSDTGFEAGRYVGGVSGAMVGIDRKTGQSFAEVDRLYVRMKAYFEQLTIINSSSIGGKRYITPGGSVRICDVEQISGGWRCWYLSEQDGEKTDCFFIEGDQAICEFFNASTGTSNKVSNQHYWRRVTAVNNNADSLPPSLRPQLTDKEGNVLPDDQQPTRTSDCKYGWFVLSATDCEDPATNDAPKADDVVTQLGYNGGSEAKNQENADRMSAIMLSTVGADAPCVKLYQGIDSYSLKDRDIVSYGYDPAKGNAYFKCYGDTYIGEPWKEDPETGELVEGDSYIVYDRNGKALDVRANFSVKSTFGDQTFEQYLQSTLPKITDESIKEWVSVLTKDQFDIIQSQIDGAIQTFFDHGKPTLANYPAAVWIADGEEEKHLGDLYYDRDSGIGYRFGKDEDGNYVWDVLKDTEVAKALADAANALNVAEGKSDVKIFAKQPLDAEEYRVGDLWVNATYPENSGSKYKNDILRANTAKAAGDTFDIAHWELASDYIDSADVDKAIASAFDNDYLRKALAAMKQDTTINGGLVLTSMIALGYNNTSIQEQIVNAGISGVREKDTDIALWLGGKMIDRESADYNGDPDAASWIARFDGSGYMANGLLKYGSFGLNIGDKIKLGTDGTMTFGGGIKIEGGGGSLSNLSDVMEMLVGLNNLLVPVDEQGNVLSYDAVAKGAKVHALKANVGLYSTGFLSALGLNDDAASGGIDLARVQKYLDDEGYATYAKTVGDIKEWVSHQNFGGDVDLSAYLTKTDADALYQPKGSYALKSDLGVYALRSEIPSLSGYATEDWVGKQGYLTASDLTGYAKTADLSGYLSLSGGTMSNTNVVKNMNAEFINGFKSGDLFRLYRIGSMDAVDANELNEVRGWYNNNGDLSGTADFLNFPFKRQSFNVMTLALGGYKTQIAVSNSGQFYFRKQIWSTDEKKTIWTDNWRRFAYASEVDDVSTALANSVSTLNTAIGKKLSIEDFEKLFKKVHLSDGTYAIEAQLGLYSKSFISALGLNGENASGGIDQAYLDAHGYRTYAYTETQIKAWVADQNFSGQVDLSAYAKTADIQKWVTDKGYITSSALTGYATQTWVAGKGYITNTTLANYYTKTETDSKIKAVKDIVDVLSDMFTFDKANNCIRANYGLYSVGFLSAMGLNGANAAGGIDSDKLETILSGKEYATQTWVSTNYALKTDIQNITLYKLTFAAGAFAAKTYDPGSASQTVSIPTNTSHISESGNLYFTNARAVAALKSVTDGLQTGINAVEKKIDDMFVLEPDGSGGYRIKAKHGLYSTGFISAMGLNGDNTSGGLDIARLKTYLDGTDSTNKEGAYATQKWVNAQGFLTSVSWLSVTDKPSWIGTSKPSYAWGEITGKPSWIGSSKPSYNFSEIGSKPTTLSGYGITDAYDKTTIDGKIKTLTDSVTSVTNKVGVLESMFTRESDGNGGYRIRANYGLYSNDFISAMGLNGDNTSGGVDETRVLEILKNNGYVKSISVSGSGNAIASVSQSGQGLAFTKGTFLTSHQALDHINSLGILNAVSGSTLPTIAGLTMVEAYGANKGYPTTFGNVLRVKGAAHTGSGELLLGWSGTDGAVAPIYYRNHRDNTASEWSEWRRIAFTTDIPTSMAWSAITGKPNVVTTDTAQTITGQKIFNSNSATNPLVVSRGHVLSESLAIGVDDSSLYFKYTNDESSSAIRFIITNTDTENSDGSNASTNNVIIYSDKNGATLDVAGMVSANLIKKKNGTSSQFLKADGSVDGNSYALNSSLSNYLARSGGSMTNTNVVTNLNADLLDGLHNGELTARYFTSFAAATDLNNPTWKTGGITYQLFQNSASNKPANYDNANALINLSMGKHGTDNEYGVQLAMQRNGNLYYRFFDSGVPRNWKTLAFTDSDITGNAGSATKLADDTARTAWGQTFFTGGKPTSVTGNLALGTAYIEAAGSNSRKIRYSGDGIKLIHDSSSAFGLDSYAPDDSTMLGTVAGSFYQSGALKRFYYGGTYDSPAMAILPSKNVGIGTTSPAYRLDVNGDIRASKIISSYASGTWLNGVSNAIINANYTTYGAVFNAPTKNGRMCVSTYPSADDMMYFGYIPNGQTANTLNKVMIFDGADDSLKVGKLKIGSVTLSCDSNGYLHIDKGVYSDSFVSAMGLNGDNTSGGVDETRVLEILKNNSYVKSISVSGSGNAIASVSQSGQGLAFTKGTFLTSHQALDHINSLGILNAVSGSTLPTIAGLTMVEAYGANKGYPTTFGNVLRVKGAAHTGSGELLLGWSGTDGAVAPIYYRNHRDNTASEWSEWRRIAFTTDIPTSMAWSAITGKPNVVTTDTAQTITGSKTFAASTIRVADGIYRANESGLTHAIHVGHTSNDHQDFYEFGGVWNFIKWQSESANTTIATLNQNGWTAPAFIKSGGTSAQFLKADGSVDGNSYALNSALGNYLPRSGGSMTNTNVVTNLNADLLDGMHNGDLTAKVVKSLGYTTAATDKAEFLSGISMVQAYQNGYPIQYGNVIRAKGGGGSELFLGWSGTTNGIAHIYYRNARDNASTFSEWSEVAFTTDNVASADKLADDTARKAWGQTFFTGGKPQSISGNMTNVGSITASGEIATSSGNAFRMKNGNYGAFIRNDGTNTHILLTASGDTGGTYNSLRPLTISNAEGHVSIAGNAIRALHGGNVGIGTTSPAYKLDVNGIIRATKPILAQGTADDLNGTFYANADSGVRAGLTIRSGSNYWNISASGAALKFYTDAWTNDSTAIAFTGTNVIVPGAITAGSLSTSGNLSVSGKATVTGAATVGAGLYVGNYTSEAITDYLHIRRHMALCNCNMYFSTNNTASATGVYMAAISGALCVMKYKATRSWANDIAKFYEDGSLWVKTGIWSDGYISAMGQNTDSDLRLKNILDDILLDIDTIANAPGKRFTWKASGQTAAGTIAQYWLGKCPEVVHRGRSGYYGVQYGVLATLMGISLAKNFKSLTARVESHEERITALEADNASLKEENRELKQRIYELENR